MTFKRFWTVWNVTEEQPALSDVNGVYQYLTCDEAETRAKECSDTTNKQYAVMEAIRMTPPQTPQWLEPVE